MLAKTNQQDKAVITVRKTSDLVTLLLIEPYFAYIPYIPLTMKRQWRFYIGRIVLTCLGVDRIPTFQLPL